MQEDTIPTVTELAALAERARWAVERTRHLVDEHRFIVAWYGMRPRSKFRAEPMLDKS
jgi:hypothetical protein